MTEEAARYEIARLKKENEHLRSLYNDSIALDKDLVRIIHEQEDAERVRHERAIPRIEDALGIRLHGWIKTYIFTRHNAEDLVPDGRRLGRTTARALRLVLSDGEPIIVRRPEDLCPYAGEDAVDHKRMQLFCDAVLRIHRKLKAAGGIDIREIERKI